uniref:Uncharacterized protein n=1 Tax=Avena sativa TaxID=4498 RepID=A0ACD5UG90_AVESA
MAGPANNHILALLLVVVSHFILALANPPTYCSVLCESEINLRLYAHQVADGPGVNQRIMISPPNDPAMFGQIAVGDWPVLVAPEPTAAIVARAKGIHVQTDRGSPTWFTSLSILFSDTRPTQLEAPSSIIQNYRQHDHCSCAYL